jgi:hypothetical protein
VLVREDLAADLAPREVAQRRALLLLAELLKRLAHAAVALGEVLDPALAVALRVAQDDAALLLPVEGEARVHAAVRLDVAERHAHADVLALAVERVPVRMMVRG